LYSIIARTAAIRMPKKKTQEYCTLEPDFPESAYILFLFILHEGQRVGIVPLDAIYPTPDAASQAAHQVIDQLGETNHITVPEESLLIPITFQSLFTMKQGFWTKPTLSYDQQMRVRAFTPVLEHPTLYYLLVTPFVYDDSMHTWHLSATLPLLYTNPTATIENFMFASDQVVEPRAKFSAIYTIGDKLRFNWKTKDIKKITQSVSEMLGKQN
jgi:hypothetical protein